MPLLKIGNFTLLHLSLFRSQKSSCKKEELRQPGKNFFIKFINELLISIRNVFGSLFFWKNFWDKRIVRSYQGL